MLRPLKAINARLGGNLLFMVLMAGGAVLSLARGFGAAIILPATDFGLYALIVAVAAFASSLAGFGKIEETRKLFPRMAVDGKDSEITSIADRLTMLVGIRLFIIAAPLFCLSWWFFTPAWAFALLAAIMLVFAIAWSGIVASVMRAQSQLNSLGASSAARAALTIFLCLFCAYKFGFLGAIFGEAVGAVVGSALMRFLLTTTKTERLKVPQKTGVNDYTISRAGILVFVAGLAAAVPIYLGRAIVGAGYSDLVLGTYSFLALLVTSVTVILGILEQIYGPKLIKSQYTGQNFEQKKRLLTKIVMVNIASILAICLLFFSVVFIPQISYFKYKYEINVEYVLPVILYCIFQITTTIDWFLQAHNEERFLATAALFQLCIFLVGSPVLIIAGFSITAILWVHAAAKAAQLLIQFYAVNRLSALSHE